MSTKWNILVLSTAVGLVILSEFCSQKQAPASQRFDYARFRDSIQQHPADPVPDTFNVLENNFRPGKVSFEHMLIRVYTLWKLEAAMLKKQETNSRPADSIPGYTLEEKRVLRDNIRELDSFLLASRDSFPPAGCRDTLCALYIEVVKSRQLLYLYIDGELADSFKVSTGIKGYETPGMNLNPRGPVLTRYTSRKFPGGNYLGLGNMPYAIFLDNGYAIHGTTPGNFSKLGRPASHGCVRLHPENARLLNELVKRVGLQNTWVRIVDHPVESSTPVTLR